jgi:o-succinylbenzoate synthase
MRDRVRIASFAVARYRLPLRQPLRAPGGLVTSRAGLVLRVVDAHGAVGVGEASPAYWIGVDSVESAAAALSEIAAADGDTTAAALRERFLDEGVLPCRSPAAACALDTALLDLEGQAAGVPIARLFADEPPRSLAVSVLLTAEGEREIARAAEHASRAGFVAVKLKVGADPLDDARRVAAARRGAGRGIELRLDANRAWSRDDAERFLALVAIHAPTFVEEPLRDPSPHAIAPLRDASGVRIALDESISNVATLEAYAAARGADVLVLKAASWGGITPAVAAGRRALELGLDVVATDSIETSIGMAAALQLAAAVSRAPAAIGLGGRAALEGDAARDRYRVPDGPRVPLPGPGLGVRLDHEALHE